MNKGFNLLELLCALAIVSILSSLAWPSYVGYMNQSRRAQVQAELTEISVELTQARLASANGLLASGTSTNKTNNNYDFFVTVANDKMKYFITATPQLNGQQVGDGLLSLTSEGLGCWHEGDDKTASLVCTGGKDHAW